VSEHATLIDALGGGTKLAKALGEMAGESLDREAVYKWKTAGVPWKWRFQVAALAKEAGKPLPEGFLPEAAA